MGNRFTSTTVIDLYKRGKFVKKLLARSVFSRTSKLGILAGNHRSRIESSANGKFHNYFFWPFPHICRETFFVYAGKLSQYMQGSFPGIYMQGKSKEISGISNFAVASASILFTIGLAIIVATRMVKAFFHYQHHQPQVNLEYVHCQQDLIVLP